MSYTPTNWTNGDVITTAKLNKIENGIAEAGNSSSGGVLVVNVTNNEGALTLNKTWQQIHDAVLLGEVVLQKGDNLYVVTIVSEDNGTYNLDAGSITYTANSASSYPTTMIK